MAEQMGDIDRRSRELGMSLYFDQPLGVNPDSYDVWRERSSFVEGMSAGAPPDLFFTAGQDWGFPPLHPERVRETGYAYPIECLRHLLRHAGTMRIDHVMGLHRLFWVPHGASATDGVYVRYRPEEWYAILCLESRRNDTVIVGEDLGVVPARVRQAMNRHGLYRSYVLELELKGRPGRAANPSSPNSMASLNTHDLPTFAGYWSGTDLGPRKEQGWIDDAGLKRERATRDRQRDALIHDLRAAGFLAKDEAGSRALLLACLSWMAAGPARMLVVNLEDLWGQPLQQNMPGTTTQYPNWRRPARQFAEFRADRAMLGTLQSVDRIRRRQRDGQ
jgi:4-alpha-glucanotransferase